MKKAFTLVELIAVITILGIVSLIVYMGVNAVIRENTDKLYEVQVTNIIQSAKNYVADNPFVLPDSEGESMQLTIETLRSTNFISGELINPKTDTEFSETDYVLITRTNGDYTYEFVE